MPKWRFPNAACPQDTLWSPKGSTAPPHVGHGRPATSAATTGRPRCHCSSKEYGSLSRAKPSPCAGGADIQAPALPRCCASSRTTSLPVARDLSALRCCSCTWSHHHPCLAASPRHWETRPTRCQEDSGDRSGGSRSPRAASKAPSSSGNGPIVPGARPAMASACCRYYRTPHNLATGAKVSAAWIPQPPNLMCRVACIQASGVRGRPTIFQAGVLCVRP